MPLYLGPNGWHNKALSLSRISQIFQSAEIPQRKLLEILTKFLSEADMLHQNIPREISIIFAAKVLQSRRYKKFLVEHTVFVKVCLYTCKVKQRLVFLTEVKKTSF